MTVPTLVAALNTGLKVSSETATFLANAGLAIAKNPASGAFDLDEMNVHNGFEHDASLSRRDYDLGGEAQAFSWEVFNETVSYYSSKGGITVKDVADARWGRVKSSRAQNPKFSLDAKHRFISYIESAAYHAIFRDPQTRLAPLEWIVVWFSQERLPYREGWRPVNDITGITIAADVLQMALLAPEDGE
ncbi:hypothetical protein LEMA_P117810.1 [Plenodomus lingam JN3]|uniref:Heme haloperoxidase family profile domain-containing protein n=2 Tax=Leptosphaeria maculans TaxID=5022 RepID=E4ZTC2_LEPMJ|nr:hypothetical protein LEMA_P117810.1 [Plenodomus lingam JN3]CBX94778.1 hypothetical protein LEMA_P117810.1 [Plenodomus lingam JN3]